MDFSDEPIQRSSRDQKQNKAKATKQNCKRQSGDACRVSHWGAVYILKDPPKLKVGVKGRRNTWWLRDASSWKLSSLRGKDNGKDRTTVRALIKERSKRKNKNWDVGYKALRHQKGRCRYMHWIQVRNQLGRQVCHTKAEGRKCKEKPRVLWHRTVHVISPNAYEWVMNEWMSLEEASLWVSPYGNIVLASLMIESNSKI